MQADAALLMEATVRGKRGEMRLHNFIGPHAGNLDPSRGGRIMVTDSHGSVVDESFAGETTYTYQLRAFCNAVRGGPALPVQGPGAVANMALIDAIRAAAGIERGR
jgi:predicted dehydrogenase